MANGVSDRKGQGPSIFASSQPPSGQSMLFVWPAGQCVSMYACVCMFL